MATADNHGAKNDSENHRKRNSEFLERDIAHLFNNFAETGSGSFHDFSGLPLEQLEGHEHMDRLAWKAAQVARYYDDALLVVESNTLETHGPSAFAFEGGDQSLFILNEIREVYDNLYARPQSADEIRQRAPVRYGFHTNVRTKPAIISTLIAMVRDGLYVERDERCLDELLTYERRPNGSYGAIDGCHDDLLMTRAIALHLSYHELPQPSLLNHKLTRPHRPHIYVEH